MRTLAVGTIKSASSAAPVFQNTSGTEIGQICKMWVNFDGTGTLAVRDSFNVSSVTDQGTGQYIINIDNDMANINYAVVLGGPTDGGNGNLGPFANARTVGTIDCFNYSQSGSFQDISSFNAAIFGD